MQTRANKRVILAVAVVIAVIASLITVGMTQANTYYWTIEEVLNQGSNAVGKAVKLSGYIDGESITWNHETMELTFALTPQEGLGPSLQVRYIGLKPDTLNDGWEAIVEGSIDDAGVFQAKELLVKCPSKYEALEEEGVPSPHPENTWSE